MSRPFPSYFFMYFLITIALVGISLNGCSSGGGTGPEALTSGSDTGVVRGDINGADVQFEFVSATNGDPDNPIDGPFAIRGRNISLNSETNELSVDLSVVNLGDNTYPEPVSLTFMGLSPDGTKVLNADNDQTGDGAYIEFGFANDDAQWTPDEESDARATTFGLDNASSVAFVARIDVGMSSSTLGSIGGMVWNDKNGDGKMGEDEPALEGVTVELLSEGNDPAMTRSGEDGSYVFEGLGAGFYEVVKRPADGWTPTTPAMIEVILVESEGSVLPFLSANFGCQQDDGSTGTIGGIVWHDANANKEIDEGEEGIAGVPIYLAVDDRSRAQRIKTDMNGRYAFEGLDEGTYFVKKMPLDGYRPTTATELEVKIEMGETVDNANFGCIEIEEHDLIQVGDCVHVKGTYSDMPDRVVATHVHVHRYDDYDRVDDNWDDHDDDDDWDDHDGDVCKRELRGPITAIEDDMVYAIMGTRVKINGDSRPKDEFEVGDRVRVRIVAPDDFVEADYLTGYDLKHWKGNGDRVRGVVEEVISNDDGDVSGFRAVSTLISFTDDTKIDIDD